MGDRLGGGSSHPGSIDGRSRGEAEKMQAARDLSAKKLWVEGKGRGITGGNTGKGLVGCGDIVLSSQRLGRLRQENSKL